MSRGKRYDDEPKLNMKKVVGTIIVLLVIIIIFITINKILSKEAKKVRYNKRNIFFSLCRWKVGSYR